MKTKQTILPPLSQLLALTILVSGCALPTKPDQTRILDNPQQDFGLLIRSLKSPVIVGDPLELYITSDKPGFLSLYHISSSQRTARLLHEKMVTAGETFRFPILPFKGSDFLFIPPAGEEIYILIATKKQHAQWLAPADLRSTNEITNLALTGQQLIDRLKVRLQGLEVDEWDSAVLRLPLLPNTRNRR